MEKLNQIFPGSAKEKIIPLYREFKLENLKRPLYKTGATDYNRLTEIENEIDRLPGVDMTTLQGKLLGVDVEKGADWDKIISQAKKIISKVTKNNIELSETDHKGEVSRIISERRGKDEVGWLEDEFGDEIRRVDEKE